MKNRLDPKWFNSPPPPKRRGKQQFEFSVGMVPRRPLTEREKGIIVKAAMWAAGEALRAIMERNVGPEKPDEPKGGAA